ncbi:MAG: ATP-binding cassette domain-containing protein [Anaerolineaceae bacterium]
MTINIIETYALSKSYGSIQAVAGIDLRVPVGTIFGFLGPNGAGKTTTIRMLLGLIHPSSGSINLYGRKADLNPQGDLRRIGSLVEAPSYYPHLTGCENLEIVCRMRGLEYRETEKTLAQVGLEKDGRRLVRQYSQGMRQRLGLGMALLGNPDLLVLDEPTNGLDPAGIHEIRELLRLLTRENGVSIFISSHLLSEVEQIAMHIGIMLRGKLLFQGTPDELHHSYTNNINIRVDRPEDACACLCSAGWQAVHNQNHTLQVPTQTDEDAVLINFHLLSNGFRVYALSPEQITLEQIFLQLTQNTVPA